jgi:hypothetical protein
MGPAVLSCTNPDQVLYPDSFAPMEHMTGTNELVYSVGSPDVPTLRFTRALAGRTSLCFEGLLAGAYVLALADSGATHSFASLNYLHSNNLCYDPIAAPDAKLADGTAV